MWPKMVLRLTAKHDTYGLSFQYSHVPGELKPTHVSLKVSEGRGMQAVSTFAHGLAFMCASLFVSPRM